MVKAGRFGTCNGSPGNQDANGPDPKPSQCEGKHPGRGRVEPLDIVDCQQDRPLLAQQAKHVAYRHAKRTVINGILSRLFSEQRDVERPSPRHRHRSDYVSEVILEQVTQPCMGEAALDLSRPARKDAQPT